MPHSSRHGPRPARPLAGVLRPFPWCSPPGIGFRARPRQLSKQVPPCRSRISAAVFGRVEMWRGGCRSDISVSAPFVWRCLSGSTVTPFPHPAHRTGRADLPHPALGQDLTPLLSRATPSAGSEPFAEFIGFPISQVLHHVLRLS